MEVDLSHLTDAERSTLLLLADGHTAKSIAAATNLSVHAVNERLREARRKTGVGSSRELARLLRDSPQENRDDKIGVAPVQAPPASTAHPIRPAAGGITKGSVIMVSLALAGAALAAWSLGMVAPAASARPKVVASQPGEGTRLDAGPFTLSVTFDRAMRADSYSFVKIDTGAYPDCATRPRRSADGKTFTLECTAAPGRSYAVGINSARFRNFVDAQTGVPAEAAVLRFSTR